jgi:hypothetical protein
MQGMVRAVLRLVLMVLVLAGVLVIATAVGVPLAAILGLSVTTAGLIAMIGLARRGVGQDPAATEPGPVMDQLAGSSRDRDTARAAVAASDPDVPADAVVAAMAPEAVVDPESLMPRWRRPSLIAARKADPTRVARLERTPMRFGPGADPSPNRRVVRYAVVSLVDRPDEVLGHRVSDLMAGDEVEVLESGAAFWEVLCPDGQRGWVHRTTLGLPGAEHVGFGRRAEPAAEPDDLLTAVLSARGIR